MCDEAEQFLAGWTKGGGAGRGKLRAIVYQNKAKFPENLGGNPARQIYHAVLGVTSETCMLFPVWSGGRAQILMR